MFTDTEGNSCKEQIQKLHRSSQDYSDGEKSECFQLALPGLGKISEIHIITDDSDTKWSWLVEISC